MGLFNFSKPAWMSKNCKKALRAAEKETDQTKLFEIAQKALYSTVRSVAINKLTDKKLLIDIVKNEEEGHIRRDIIERLTDLTDQIILFEIVKDDKNTGVREAAVKKLIDQRLLAEIAKDEIAKKSLDSTIRFSVVIRLADQDLLTEFAKNDSKELIREAAIKRLAELIVQKTHFHPFLEWQLKGLTDQSLFTDIAKNDYEGIVRTAVVKKIGGETLDWIAQYDSDIFAREAAVESKKNGNFNSNLISDFR